MQTCVRRLLQWLARRGVILGLVFLAGIVLAFGWQLGSEPPAFSPAEAASRDSSSSPGAITDNPINAPHKLLQLALQSQQWQSPWSLRAVSAIFAVAGILCLYYILKNLFGRLMAGLGTVIFATTPWIMNIGRSATPEVLWLFPIFLAAAYMWLARSKRRREPAWIALCVLTGAALYVPGLVWLIPVIALILRRRLAQQAREIRPFARYSGLLLALLLVAPLAWSMVGNWPAAKDLLLIPDQLPNIVDFLKSSAWSLLSLAWRTSQHIDLIIGRWPLLNIFQLVLVLFGAYALWSRARQALIALAGLILMAVLAAGFNQSLSLLTLALPPLAVIMAAGLRYLYVEWRSVFPKNPIPQGVALATISLVLIAHVAYGVRYTHLAWPHTIHTKSTYVIK